VNITKIIVHCSDSPQGRGDNAETIHLWHLARGWWGIGYNSVILENGAIEQGRPTYWSGAHVNGHNQHSVGVCLIGRGGDATMNQLQSLRHYIATIRFKFPDAEVLGHSDLDSKKSYCPGFDVKLWWSAEVE